MARQSFAGFRDFEGLDDFSVEFLYDRRGCACGREKAEPADDQKTRQPGLGNRRNICYFRHARSAGYRQRAQLTGFDLLQSGGDGRKINLHTARDEIDNGRTAAFVGDADNIDAGHAFE